MEKFFDDVTGQWMLEAAKGCILHRKGSEDFTRICRAVVADPEAWEDVAAEAVPQYSHEEYCAEVERLIALRYSHGREIEVNRERDEKPERFAEYMAYVAACKVQAKELLTGDSSSTGEQEGQETPMERESF